MVPAPKVPPHPFREDPGPVVGPAAYDRTEENPQAVNIAEEEVVKPSEVTNQVVAVKCVEAPDFVPPDVTPPHGENTSTDAAPNEEEEVEVEYNVARENVKALAGTVTVVLVALMIYLWFYISSSDFEEPVCVDEDAVIASGAEYTKPRSCEPCGSGTLFLPLSGEYEKQLPKEVRAVLYFVGLLWIFLGVGVVCDQFMAGIEEITSQERTHMVEVRPGAKHKFHVKVWNGTVANLTLMALGSSAPEILLNVIEIIAGKFFAGELGPSTIVGSAAFNLLVITAVCVSALPANEVRKIDNTDVFTVTASLSVFAYVWLVVILQLNTADKVDLWEALLTFSFFPILVVVAFCADKGYIARMCGNSESKTAKEEQEILKKYGKELPPEELSLMVLSQQHAAKPTVSSKAKIRKALMSALIGGSNRHSITKQGDDTVRVGFAQSRYTVFECVGTFRITVVASRAPGVAIMVQYTTREGSAKENNRYKMTEGTLTFSPFQTEQTIEIPIIDNDVFEDDESFYVQLFNLQIQDAVGKWRPSVGSSGSSETPTPKSWTNVRLGTDLTTVTILNDDMPGTLEFDTEEVYTSSGSRLHLGVTRTHGTSGDIKCRYRTVDVSAVAGQDYTAIDQEFCFKDSETHAEVYIDILGSAGDKPKRVFQVVLECTSPGVKFNPDTNGGAHSSICDCVVQGNVQPSTSEKILAVFWDGNKAADACHDYANQFRSAFYCNGGPAEQSTAGCGDWFFHGLSLFWKVLFAFVPPPAFCGGWLCFWCALAMIGLVTAFVGDIAGLLGCCLDIPDDITAITLVALGTSLPDTFASKVAAQQNPTADDSIGNVTGSNCVNVFLGLGLPWTLGAIYWHNARRTDAWDARLYQGETFLQQFGDRYPDGGFMVPAGSLSFSVIVFTSCALTCIAILALRRVVCGGELGGSKFASTRDSTILVCLWFVYIALSIWKSLESQ